MSGSGHPTDAQLGQYSYRNNGYQQPQYAHPSQYQPHFATGVPALPAPATGSSSSGIKIKFNLAGGGGTAREASPPQAPQYPQGQYQSQNLTALAYPNLQPGSSYSQQPPASVQPSANQFHQTAALPQTGMARTSGRNAGPVSNDSGRPSRARNNVNYQEDRLTQISNPAVVIQQGQQHTGISTRRSIAPISNGSRARGYGAVKEEDEEPDFQDDGEVSFDDSGEYSAGGGRGKAGSKAPARGGGNGKSQGRKAPVKRRSNAYGNEDDEDDFVAEDDDDEAEFDGDDGDELAIGFRRQSSRRAAKPAAPAVKHPNLQHFSESSDEDEDEDKPLAAMSSQYVRNSTSAAPMATQFVPDSEADAHYVVPGSVNGNRRLGQGVVSAHQLLFSDNAPTTSATSRPSGSKARIPSSDDNDEDAEGEVEPASEGYVVTSAGPSRQQQQIQLLVPPPPQVKAEAYQTGSGRRTVRRAIVESDNEEEDAAAGAAKKRGPSRSDRKYLGDGSESGESYSDDDRAYGTSRRKSTRKTRFVGRITRNSRRAMNDDDDEEYEESSRRRHSTESSDDLPLVLTDTESQDELMLQSAGRRGKDGKNYRLRKRKQEVNYNLPAMFGLNPDGSTAIPAVSDKPESSSKKGKKKRSGYGGPKHLPFNMSGKQLGHLFGEANDSSSDDDGNTPRRPAGGLLGAGAMSAGSMPMDFASGTPANLGKISGATNLADIDPLLPSTQLSFDSVGGLQSHIQQLKEMVSLPLLYPEVFQRFGITPPRGVLFHGPPGTGKTLLARALAASCSSQGQKISFFMRKGADVLSKWVGEAERQLRLLFEEAKNSQPSIIFFDEIDGLAPVRSSKQDQIHASIVSTLLALMDGMDGRGQVIVIGATNRPDAVDPALRRPGRFDREFYFPLPDLEARRKIIEINTKKWEPPIRPEFLYELAHLTKGYGGADLRALCTEAALNAVQRKYPQIYKTTDRLLIKPEEIDVVARDFIISAKNLIPSTARSTSALASALPPHLEPLLRANLEKAVASLSKIMPEVKKLTVLEEAQYEPLGDGGFEQERYSQNFEKLRVFRPRLLITGKPDMAQDVIGAAILHHLEGFHIQSLDLTTLVGDSARTAEAACVQIFTEAKRHKPSIIYIPSIADWSEAVGESAKKTVQRLLKSLDPSDPILLLGISDVPFSELNGDIKSWFGLLKNNRVVLDAPTSEQREAFFEETLASIQKEPTSYPDAMPRKKRVLEELPIAPPLPPREPTAAEIDQQSQADVRLREYLKFRLGPIVADLKKRFKRFCKPVGEPGEEIEILPPGSDPIEEADAAAEAEADDGVVEVTTQRAPEKATSSEPVDIAETLPHVNSVDADQSMEDVDAPTKAVNGTAEASKPSEGTAVSQANNGETTRVTADEPVTAKEPAKKLFFKFHDMSLDKMESKIYGDRYLGPELFLTDIEKIVENAYADGEDEVVAKAQQMLNASRIMVDQACDLSFRMECARMAQRETNRQKAKQEKKQKAREEKEKARLLAATPATTATGSVASTSNGLNKRLLEDGDDGNDSSKRQRLDQSDVEMMDATTQANTVLNGQPSSAIGLRTGGIIPESPSPALASRSVVGLNQTATSASLVLASTSPANAAAPTFAMPSGSGLPTPVSTTSMTNKQAAGPGSISSSLIGEAILPPSLPATRPASPEPEPEPHPPFFVPQSEIQQLKQFFANHTADLSVDELEQLRAACYDAIWRARREWDKTRLVKEISELANEYIEELEESRLAE